MSDLDALLATPSGARLAPTPDGRLKCSLTGHVLPRHADVVAAYLNGPKFARRAAAVDELDGLLAQEPALTPSKNFEGKLYCALTCHLVNAHPAAVARHLGGKKYKAATAAAAAGDLEAAPEPDLGSEEAEAEEAEEEEDEFVLAELEEEEEEVVAAPPPPEKKRAARPARPKRSRRAEV